MAGHPTFFLFFFEFFFELFLFFFNVFVALFLGGVTFGCFSGGCLGVVCFFWVLPGFKI